MAQSFWWKQPSGSVGVGTGVGALGVGGVGDGGGAGGGVGALHHCPPQPLHADSLEPHHPAATQFVHPDS